MSWPQTPFETLYAVPSRNGIYKPKEFHGTGCRMVNMGELFGFDFISDQDMERVELNDAEQSISALEDGDLLFGRRSLVEAGAGKCSLVVEPPDILTFESSIIRVRLDKRRVNPRFLYYYFRSPQGRGLVRSIVSGTNVKGIRSSELKKLPVATPPKTTQDNIASTLSLYDALIDNNQRRTTILQNAARLLYQEWFVHLRFPGHEHTRIDKGIPQGWERKTAHEALEILSGGTPKTSVPEFWGGEIPFYTPKDAPDGVWVTDCERNITEVGLSGCNSRLFPKGTVFISARGTVGKLNIAQRPMAMSQSCYALVRKGHLTQPFVFFAMQEAVAALRQQAVGAVFDAIIVDTFKRISFLIPPPKTVRLFDEVARPVLAQLENLTLQNQKLRAARDLLLPRLMTGEVTV
ncbi:MAG: restriction endonuclease subunit S [Verrucomicrobiota bacterium]